TISSPQGTGAPFNIGMTAQDQFNNTATNFSGTVNLTTTAGTISPTVSGAFAAGLRTQTVTVSATGTSRTITATRTGGTQTGTSNPFDVNFCGGASIASQPASQTGCPGVSVTFTVVPGGTPPLGYQWRKAGVNIGGATSTNYTVNSITASDAGNYDVVITNACGSVTS